MQGQDRSTKLLLTLLVIGLWGLLLRPYVTPTPVQAQGKATRKYELCYTSRKQPYGDNDGKVTIGGSGIFSLTSVEMADAIDIISKRGWKLHSVVKLDAGDSWIVIAEK